jgi:hypothetical protein
VRKTGEKVFNDRLSDIPVRSFGKYPALTGIQASTGRMYQSKLKLMKYRLNFYSNIEKTPFQKWVFWMIKTLRGGC